jgi:hypothetical protein
MSRKVARFPRFLSLFAASLFAALSAANAAPQTPSKSLPAAQPPRPPSGAILSKKVSDYREDFSVLTLQGSVFVPIPPALGQLDNDPHSSFTRERWQVGWRPSDPIDLFVIKPKGVKNPPVILYLYTYPGDTERFKTDDWAGAATANGFAAVAFVSAYTGHRTEFRTVEEAFVPKLQESLASTVHDVQLILDYLATRGDLDLTHVGMFGQGSGGTIAILASAADPRIKSVDVLNPWGDWPEFFAASASIAKDARPKYLAPAFQDAVRPLDPLLWLPKMKCASFRMQNVRKSRPMPDDLQIRLEAAVPPFAIVNQYGDSAALFPHASGGALFGWIKSQLQPEPGAQVAAEHTDKADRVHFFPARAPADPLNQGSKTEQK